MSLRCSYISDLAQFGEFRQAWNDLWARSGSHVCNDRHELVTINARSFALSGNSFGALMVFDEHNRGLFALPFWRSHSRFISSARCLGNPFSPISTCLLDPSADLRDVFVSGSECLDRQGIQIVSLKWLRLEHPAIGIIHLDQRSWNRQRFQAAQIDLRACRSFDKAISSNHRKKLRRWQTKLEQLGTVKFVEVDTSDNHAACLGFQSALQLEHDSWKGREGSSILSSKAQTKYWTDWFHALIAANHLRLYLLTLNDEPIAFDMGYATQGIYSSVKISHTQRLSELGLGHVRDYFLVKHLLDQGEIQWIDTVGPGTDIKWPHRLYSVGNVHYSTGSWWGDRQIQTLVGVSSLKIFLYNESFRHF